MLGIWENLSSRLEQLSLSHALFPIQLETFDPCSLDPCSLVDVPLSKTHHSSVCVIESLKVALDKSDS